VTTGPGAAAACGPAESGEAEGSGDGELAARMRSETGSLVAVPLSAGAPVGWPDTGAALGFSSGVLGTGLPLGIGLTPGFRTPDTGQRLGPWEALPVASSGSTVQGSPSPGPVRMIAACQGGVGSVVSLAGVSPLGQGAAVIPAAQAGRSGARRNHASTPGRTVMRQRSSKGSRTGG